jgi:hypothetical protein
MTAVRGDGGIHRRPRLISWHGFVNDAHIWCKDDAGIRTPYPNPLIAFKYLRVAQPVLRSEPDPGTHGAQQHPAIGRGTSFDEAHYRDYQTFQA